MRCTGKEQLTCNEEKMGCEGCYYNDDKNKDDIKVGEYARTKKQGIKRIGTIFENRTVNKYGYEIGSEWDGKLYSIIKTTDIVNHSKDIAELIGYGDFINGKMCIDIEHYTRDDGTKGINFVCIGGSVLEENIKSIVTKEQFKSVEFRLEE